MNNTRMKDEVKFTSLGGPSAGWSTGIGSTFPVSPGSCLLPRYMLPRYMYLTLTCSLTLTVTDTREIFGYFDTVRNNQIQVWNCTRSTSTAPGLPESFRIWLAMCMKE